MQKLLDGVSSEESLPTPAVTLNPSVVIKLPLASRLKEPSLVNLGSDPILGDNIKNPLHDRTQN